MYFLVVLCFKGNTHGFFSGVGLLNIWIKMNIGVVIGVSCFVPPVRYNCRPEKDQQSLALGGVFGNSIGVNAGNALLAYVRKALFRPTRLFRYRMC